MHCQLHREFSNLSAPEPDIMPIQVKKLYSRFSWTSGFPPQSRGNDEDGRGQTQLFNLNEHMFYIVTVPIRLSLGKSEHIYQNFSYNLLGERKKFAGVMSRSIRKNY